MTNQDYSIIIPAIVRALVTENVPSAIREELYGILIKFFQSHELPDIDSGCEEDPVYKLVYQQKVAETDAV